MLINIAEEKIEKGVISEEALEEIAGGLNISKDTLKKVAIDAGVIIGTFALGAGAGVGVTILTQKLRDPRKKEKQTDPFGDEYFEILDR